MSEAAPASPAAGQAPAEHHPARGGAAPLPGEPIRTAHRTRDQAHRAARTTATKDPRRAAEAHLPIRADITTAAHRRAEALRLPAGARLLRAEAAPLRDNTKGMSAAAQRNPDRAHLAAHTAQAVQAPHPVPAAAGDTVPPAPPVDRPAARVRKGKNVVIASAFSRERSSFFPSRLYRSQ